MIWKYNLFFRWCNIKLKFLFPKIYLLNNESFYEILNLEFPIQSRLIKKKLFRQAQSPWSLSLSKRILKIIKTLMQTK